MLIRNDYKPQMAKKMKSNHAGSFSAWRIYLVLFGVVLALALLVGRILYFQFEVQEKYKKDSDNVFVRKVTSYGHRGNIYDRNHALLAINHPVADIIVDSYHLPDFDTMKRQAKGQKKKYDALTEAQQTQKEKIIQLAQLLGLPEKELFRKLNRHTYQPLENARAKMALAEGELKNGDYYLRRHVPKEVFDKIEELNISGIKVAHMGKRHHPGGSAFASVIGITNTTSFDKGKRSRVVGLEGLELVLNDRLSGEDGLRVMIKANGDRYIEDIHSPENRLAKNGEDVVLSLDKNIQILARDSLKKAVERHKADKASAVVLDAKTGEILAMANYPDFDPENYQKIKAQKRRNHAAVDVFEPGSTIKPLVVAKVLDEGQTTPNELIDTRPYRIDGWPIRDYVYYPSLSVSGIIQKSSNVGVSRLAQRLSNAKLYEYYRQIGIGHKPNSGFPGESAGVLRNVGRWRSTDKIVMSYGYGFQMSLLQLARSYTIFTNNGALLPVTFFKQDAAPKGEQVIRPRTAKQVSMMMQQVTEPGGTGTRGAVEGYHVAGKSGTAEQVAGKGKDGAYQKDRNNVMFAGFAPVSNPRVIVAVKINHPRQNGHLGGAVAAPVFAEIMQGSLDVLAVPPDTQTDRIITLKERKPDKRILSHNTE